MTAKTRQPTYLAQRVQNMPASGIRRFFDLLGSIDGVISLGVGEPDFVTPWHIRDAAIRSLERGHTHYTSNYGLPELRSALAAKTRPTVPHSTACTPSDATRKPQRTSAG